MLLLLLLPLVLVVYEQLIPRESTTTQQQRTAGYTSKLNAAIEGTDLEGKTIENILINLDMSNKALRNNGGGFYNHSLFWEVMSPNGGGKPSGELADAINGSGRTSAAFIGES